MGRLIYLTGPVRSGKSRRAVEIASDWGPQVVFVATYRNGDDDVEMMERVRRHRAERPAWRTLENVPDVAEALQAVQPAPTGVVLDCLTLWASDHWEMADDQITAEWGRQLMVFRQAPWPLIVVSNEVGWSLVPERPELRRFRDVVGTLGQLTAAAADEAWLMCAGCAIRLK